MRLFSRLELQPFQHGVQHSGIKYIIVFFRKSKIIFKQKHTRVKVSDGGKGLGRGTFRDCLLFWEKRFPTSSASAPSMTQPLCSTQQWQIPGANGLGNHLKGTALSKVFVLKPITSELVSQNSTSKNLLGSLVNLVILHYVWMFSFSILKKEFWRWNTDLLIKMAHFSSTLNTHLALT